MNYEGSGEGWRTWAAILFVCLVILLGVYLLFRYAVGILLPFLIAWAVGAVVHPLAVRVSERLHLPQKLCAVVLMLLLLTLLGLILTVAVDMLLTEIRQLLARLESDGGLEASLSAWTERIRELVGRLPFFRHLPQVAGSLEGADVWMSEMLREVLGGMSRKLPDLLGRTVRALPSAVIFSVVMLIAGFYFSADLEAVHRALGGLLPRRIVGRLPAWKRRLSSLVRQYVRAYLLLLVITFLELYIALSLLGVEYHFLIAALTALLDILPLFGVGIVLIPWAIVLLLGRKFYQGIGLLITYAVVTVVRQIIEPRVVSGSLGLHPLLTLFCMYVGYRLFGILGMMLAPAAAILLSGRLSADQSSSGSGA